MLRTAAFRERICANSLHDSCSLHVILKFQNKSLGKRERSHKPMCIKISEGYTQLKIADQY